MPAASKPPTAPPPSPAALKVLALVGWYAIVALMYWRGDLGVQATLGCFGGPLGFVLGFKVSDWLRAILIKR